MSSSSPPSRRGRRRRSTKAPQSETVTPTTTAIGGHHKSLCDDDLERIHQAVLHILSQIGLADVSPRARALLLEVGAHESDDSRMLFPATLVRSALSQTPAQTVLCGRRAHHDMTLSGDHVYTGTGGAAPTVVDLGTGMYRNATLRDLFNAAKLVDALPHIHFFSRSLVATDIADPRELDLSTTLVCLAGTSKHVMVSASDASHVREIADICYQVAGSEAAFRARPFLSLNVNHAVPPLRFHGDSCDVLIEAVHAGIPVHVNVFGQLGASSPVTIAGSVAQTTAETLAGVILAWATKPAAAVIAGPRPMITDLRTGAMSGGSGEQALANCAAIEMMRHYHLPNSIIAGATDSKAMDAQAGYEKALSVSQAVQSGAHLITQACGMHAGLMGVAYESYVMDNDMLGAILRSATAIEVSDQTLAIDSIAQAVHGEGHFLGHGETYARMKSDFLYPDIADRRSVEEWTAAGQPELLSVARNRVRTLLDAHSPEDTSTLARLADTLALNLVARGVNLG
jgi:trimethylamine---corrinoid protein Co-methyltransferase